MPHHQESKVYNGHLGDDSYIKSTHYTRFLDWNKIFEKINHTVAKLCSKVCGLLGIQKKTKRKRKREWEGRGWGGKVVEDIFEVYFFEKPPCIFSFFTLLPLEFPDKTSTRIHPSRGKSIKIACVTPLKNFKLELKT